MLITLSRQYAAGGADVARRVAEMLGWSVVDNEFVDRIAARTGLPPEAVAAKEERVPGFLERFSRSAAIADPELLTPDAPPIPEPDEARLVKLTRDLVAELAREGRKVVVGRAAAAVLAEAPDAVHARVVASRAFRIRYAIERLDVDPAKAGHAIDQRDRNYARYHREYYGRDWADPLNYHLVLNTERLGFERASALIVALARSFGA